LRAQFAFLADLCGNGKTEGRHAWHDLVECKRSTGWTNHTIPHLAGLISTTWHQYHL